MSFSWRIGRAIRDSAAGSPAWTWLLGKNLFFFLNRWVKQGRKGPVTLGNSPQSPTILAVSFPSSEITLWIQVQGELNALCPPDHLIGFTLLQASPSAGAIGPCFPCDLLFPIPGTLTFAHSFSGIRSPTCLARPVQTPFLLQGLSCSSSQKQLCAAFCSEWNWLAVRLCLSLEGRPLFGELSMVGASGELSSHT